MTEDLMIPPHSVEAEQAVLGAVLLSGNPSQVMDLLTTEGFYRHDHQAIWKAVTALSDAGKNVDVVTVSEHMSQAGTLDVAGGRGYIGRLAAESNGGANARSYAQIVADRAQRRQMIATAANIMESAKSAESARDALDEAQGSIMQIGAESDVSGPMLIRDAMNGWLDEMQRRSESKDGVTGLPTGYRDLDKRTTGLHPGNLVIVAGRPSMGKTSFAMGPLAECGRNRIPALAFSMEMSREEVVERAIAADAGVGLHAIRSAQLSNDEWLSLTESTARLREWPLLIDDTPALKVNQIRARARRAKQRHGIKLVVVDYLSLAKGEGENRTNQIGDVSQNLKALAKELDLPVLALSQLNRGLENRPNKRPMLADLRESGQVEQDADIIIFPYRDKIYNKKSPFGNLAEIIVAKQRNGAPCTFPMVFLDETAEYKDAAPGTVLPDPDNGVDYSGNGGFD